MAQCNSVERWMDAPRGGPLPCELFGAMAELCSVCALYHDAYVEAAVDAADGVDCGQSEPVKEALSWTSTEEIAWVRLVDPTRHPWCLTEQVEGVRCDACR